MKIKDIKKIKELEKKKIKEEKLINELVAFAKKAVDPEFAVECLIINYPPYKKILHRKIEILELIKNG